MHVGAGVPPTLVLAQDDWPIIARTQGLLGTREWRRRIGLRPTRGLDLAPKRPSAVKFVWLMQYKQCLLPSHFIDDVIPFVERSFVFADWWLLSFTESYHGAKVAETETISAIRSPPSLIWPHLSTALNNVHA